MKPGDLDRLTDSEELPSDLQAGIEGLRQRTATDARMSRLAARLGAVGVATALTTTSAHGLAKSVSLLARLTGAKLIFTATAVPIVAAFAIHYATGVKPAATNHVTQVTVAATNEAAPTDLKTTEPDSPIDPEAQQLHAARASTAEVDAVGLGSSANHARAQNERRPASVPGPSPAPPSESLSVDPSRSQAAVNPLDVQLLHAARTALATQPERALALTKQHENEFRSSSFSQEREIIAITALLRMGLKSEALERADRFRRAFPNSAYLRQLERLGVRP